MLLEDFRRGFKTLGEGEEWFAWIGSVGYHPKGLTFWVATSANVPPGVLGTIEDIVRIMGFATARTTGSPGEMNPLLYVGADGVELLRMI